jgi:hypothetical protein
MPDNPLPGDPRALRPWHDAHAGEALTARDDEVSARQWLAPAVGDDAALAALRLMTLGLADGTELSRLDDQQLVDHLATAIADGRLRSAGVRPVLRRLVPAPAPAQAPTPAPVTSARRAAPVVPPPAAESTFGSGLDVAAMVAVLVRAAQDGVPFCEECARAAAERDHTGATA